MTDPRPVLEAEGRRFIQADGAFERLVRRRDRKRRNQRISAGLLGLAIAIAGGWLAVGAIRSATTVPGHDPTPTSPPTATPTLAPTAWSPVQDDELAIYRTTARRDPHDTKVKWIDVEHVRFRVSGQPHWEIELAAAPPPAAGLEEEQLIAYGLVLDTTADGIADYVIGIDNDAPERGDFHVWVTDLATGETDEQIGPPYGVPVEFYHPDEWEPGDPPGFASMMVFTFLGGTTPPGFTSGTVRFYAWASATRDGEVIGFDHAPDAGWLTSP